MRAFRHRDFRLLWTGAFLSFIGSWIQTIGQGWLVFSLTHSETKLAIVTFCGAIPVTAFGPFAGAIADRLNKRIVLLVTQAVFAVNAIILASLSWTGQVQYWHIVIIALINGCNGCIEMPTRQSVVSRVVPPEDLATAVPLNAMTFNMARLVGPAIGGILLARYGPQTCYLVNGISFAALMIAALAIRSDLRSIPDGNQEIRDLLLEGMLYTFKDARLRLLFILEASIATFGIFYISLMPAIIARMLVVGPPTPALEKVQKMTQGYCFTAIGVGAFIGLVLVTHLSGRGVRGEVIGFAMLTLGIGLFSLSFARSMAVALPLFALTGMGSIMQFNMTNTLFQILSPDRLRGRVLAMHIWALSGLSPFGALYFGWLSSRTSMPVALGLGGIIVLGFAWYGFTQRTVLGEPANA